MAGAPPTTVRGVYQEGNVRAQPTWHTAFASPYENANAFSRWTFLRTKGDRSFIQLIVLAVSLCTDFISLAVFSVFMPSYPLFPSSRKWSMRQGTSLRTRLARLWTVLLRIFWRVTWLNMLNRALMPAFCFFQLYITMKLRCQATMASWVPWVEESSQTNFESSERRRRHVAWFPNFLNTILTTIAFSVQCADLVQWPTIAHSWPGGYAAYMVCNLLQNPGKRPVIANWLPALLRQGLMYLVALNGGDREERWLMDVVTLLVRRICWFDLIWLLDLDLCFFRVFSSVVFRDAFWVVVRVDPAKEHMHAMGCPQFPGYGDPSDPFPIHEFDPPSTSKKRLAGNVF